MICLILAIKSIYRIIINHFHIHLDIDDIILYVSISSQLSSIYISVYYSRLLFFLFFHFFICSIFVLQPKKNLLCSLSGLDISKQFFSSTSLVSTESKNIIQHNRVKRSMLIIFIDLKQYSHIKLYQAIDLYDRKIKKFT